ncbi:MAG TPA: transcription termination/antitermination NusG family protein, partial [Microthrixaceae bacterium]|nr:transcription termination/antitermination NusG family protein [Microthrixaceae bacterium]
MTDDNTEPAIEAEPADAPEAADEQATTEASTEGLDTAEVTETDEAPAEATDADVLDEDDLLEEDAAPKVESPYDRPGKWFVLHTQSGYENKVRQNLEARTHSMNMEERIYEVVIPLEDVVEIRNGKKVVVQKKMFPGYLLVRCRLDDDSWY